MRVYSLKCLMIFHKTCQGVQIIWVNMTTGYCSRSYHITSSFSFTLCWLFFNLGDRQPLNSLLLTVCTPSPSPPHLFLHLQVSFALMSTPHVKPFTLSLANLPIHLSPCHSRPSPKPFPLDHCSFHSCITSSKWLRDNHLL